MGVFLRADERFAEVSADDMRRRSAINNYPWRRTLLFWCAVVLSIGAVATSFTSTAGGGGLLLCAAMQWTLALKFASDLRVVTRPLAATK
jgi:hypothetical protein